MVSLEEAVRLLKAEVRPISEVEKVSLEEACGRVLARDIIAGHDQPPFPRSPLDGYALKGEETLEASEDHPVTLKVVGKIYAGEVFPGTVGPGECIRIMTGAPIPEGADTVIRQEDTDYEEIRKKGKADHLPDTTAVKGTPAKDDGRTDGLPDTKDDGRAAGLPDTKDDGRAAGLPDTKDDGRAGRLPDTKDETEGPIWETGSPGYNAPELVENRFRGTGDLVRIYKGSAPYRNYCYAGEDYKCGDILVEKGQLINGSRLGIIAGAGREEIEVYKEPKITIISTGDEVISPGQPIKPGKIYDSNRYLVYGRLRDLGVKNITSFHCPDEAKDMIAAILDRAGDSDLIITTGGVSVGEKDIMHEVKDALEAGRSAPSDTWGEITWTAKKLFWKVDLKPGAPTLAFTLAGRYHDKGKNIRTKEVLVVCLTGNPYGVAVNFELLIRPVLAVLTGNDRVNKRRRSCILENDSPKRGGRRRFLRGYLMSCSEEGAGEAQRVMIVTGNQAAGTLASLDKSNCLVEISPEGSGKAGEMVFVYPF